MNYKYYLFRHGLAIKPGQNYQPNNQNIPLLPEAKKDIIKLANKLKHINTDLNLCSQYLRCRQTADLVAQITGKKFIIDAKLNEFQSETFAQFKNRIKSFLKKIHSQNSQHILICTHGAVIAAITHLVKEGKFKLKHELDYPPPAGLRIL